MADIKVSELLKILTGPDRIRIKKDNKKEYCGYVGLVPEEYMGEAVKRFKTSLEINHKEWEARGLMPPENPEDIAKYKFSDFEMRIYYDIHI